MPTSYHSTFFGGPFMRFELMIFFGNISSRDFIFVFILSLSLFLSVIFCLFISFCVHPKWNIILFFEHYFSFCTCRSFVKTFISTNLDICLCSFAFWNRSLLESRLFHSNTITPSILFYSRVCVCVCFFSSLHGYQMERRNEKSRLAQSTERKKFARKENQPKTMKM